MPNQTRMEPVRVAVAGASGKMGREAVRALRADARLAVCSVLVRDAGQAYGDDYTCPVYDEADRLIQETRPDVWLDLTDARSVVRHINLCVDSGVHPVVGATGYTAADVARWQDACREQRLGGVVAPNFAIGALLMMRFASEAARHMNDVEIIELHHDGKRDAPSGTAKRTAQTIAAQRQTGTGTTHTEASAPQAPSRGLEVDGIPVHSIRLPGLVAHQEVIFGGTGEVLTIRHDSLSRTSFMPGICLACAKSPDLQELVYGLEHLLW